MSYVFTEVEYSMLQRVNMQLEMLSALLAKPGRVDVGCEALECMFSGLKEPIEKVIDTLHERSALARQSEGMHCFDWMHIITLVSGRDSMSVSDIVAMDEKLAKAVEIDPDMECVFNAWRAVQPEIAPATEQSILNMYGAKNARELLKNLVSMTNRQPA